MGARCCRWHVRKVGVLDEPVTASDLAGHAAAVGGSYDVREPATALAAAPPPSDAAKNEVRTSGLAGSLDSASDEKSSHCPFCGPGGVLELRSSVNVDNLFGWYCDNFHICGESESSGAGRWRWSCHCCQRDYCRKCYACLEDGGDLANTLRDMEVRELDALDGVKAATLDLIQMRSEIHGVPLPPTDWAGEEVQAPLTLTTAPDRSLTLPVLPADRRGQTDFGSAENLPQMLPPLPALAEGPASLDSLHMVKHRNGQAVEEVPREAAVDAATGETAAFLTELMRRPKLPDQSEDEHLLDKLMLEHRLRTDSFSLGDICEGKAASGRWWPVIITASHPDGTYAVDVHDGVDSKWPVVYRENLRRTVPRPKFEPENAVLQGDPAELLLSDSSLLQDRLDEFSSELAAERQQAADQMAAVKNLHAAELAELKASQADERRHLEAELRAESERRTDALVSELVAAHTRADGAVASLVQIKEQHLKDQATRSSQALKSLDLAHKRLAADDGQIVLRLCFKSWVLICCVRGPPKLNEEVPPRVEVEPKASSSCTSQPKDTDFEVPFAAVNARAQRLEAELDAVAAQLAIRQEEVQEALNAAVQVRIQECNQGCHVFSELAMSPECKQRDTINAIEQAHVGPAATKNLSGQGTASGVVEPCQHNYLEVFITYTHGFANSSKLSMKLGCGRRKEALMATMQIHPLCFDLGSCFETGAKAYMTGSASLSLRASSIVGEAMLVLHPMHDRYHVCLHAPDPSSELGAGLPADAEIADKEIRTSQNRIRLDLCIRGPSASVDVAMMSRAAIQQHPYLRRHALEQYMAGLLRTMAHEKIADPYAFMREQLQALAQDLPQESLAYQSLDCPAAAPAMPPVGSLEVSLYGAEDVPEGAVICFGGLLQGKAAVSQLLQGSILRLPVQSGIREPLKVTVLHAKHETTLPLDPAQLHYQATFWNGSEQHDIGLHVRAVNSKRLLAADVAMTASPGKRTQFSRPRDSARQYIRSQGLVTLAQELLRDLVTEQPANPYRFLLARLDGRRPFCPEPVFGWQSGKKEAVSGNAETDREAASLDRQLREMMDLVAKVADSEE